MINNLQVFVTSKGFDKLFYGALIFGCLGAFASGYAGEHLSEVLAWATSAFATLSNASPSELARYIQDKKE